MAKVCLRTTRRPHNGSVKRQTKVTPPRNLTLDCCTNMATVFPKMGVPQDYQQAVFWFRKAAEQGEVNAEVNLAWQYASGLGVPQNHAEAVTWCGKAADQGDVQSQAWIAREQQHMPKSGMAQKTRKPTMPWMQLLEIALTTILHRGNFSYRSHDRCAL